MVYQSSRSLTDRIRDCMEHEADSKTYGHSEEELPSSEELLRSMLQYESNVRGSSFEVGKG